MPRGLLPRGGAVLVALGAPKQELWIRRALDRPAPPNVFVGVGGAVDYLSGAARVPPAWMSRCGLEWLFRLLLEPRRLARQGKSLIPFVRREIVLGLLRREARRG
jgi:N-acetylglucosaminyldiphosphoundecaprenol N-acetyl-beta-D-mannosaminyltransferase